jgi:hypothetical protein
MHHEPVIFNGIWSDMAIETTYMRYNSENSEMIGLTMKSELWRQCAMSINAINTVISDLNTITDD